MKFKYLFLLTSILMATAFTACSSGEESKMTTHFALVMEEQDQYKVGDTKTVELKVLESLENITELYLPVNMPVSRLKIANIVGNDEFDWSYDFGRNTYFFRMVPKNSTISADTVLASFDITMLEPSLINISFINGDIQVIGEDGENYASLDGHTELDFKVIEE